MKKMSKGMLMTALICGAVYLGGSPVYASELQEFSLDEYVVTAARTETKLVDTPANITVVDAQTIEERHYQDVSEVLKDVPGANVMDSGVGAYEKAITLNGDTRVLVLVDGRRVDFAAGTSSGRASIDMGLLPDVNMIERIEVLKGAGGALYGSDAVGGVVNIITKKADMNYGKVSVGFGSFGAEDYSAMYSMKTGRTGFAVSASKYEQDYHKYRDAKTDTTKRWPYGSDIDSEKVSFKLDQELSNTTNLQIGYDYSKYDGLSMGSMFNPYGVSRAEREINNIYAKVDWNLNEGEGGYFQVYRNEYDYYSAGAPNNPYYAGILWGDANEKTWGVDMQQAFSVTDTNKLVAGFSWRDSDVLNVSDSGVYDENVKNTAVFINDTWEFAPSWILNTGIRYDDHSKSGDETTMSAGLNKKFDENSHAYINWGEVFKAPTTGDLYAIGMGNPELKAETGETWTIGYSTKVNDVTELGISYFESDIENAIAYDVKDNYIPKNIAKQEKRGLEITLKHELNENVDLEASYSYIRAKNDENNENGFIRDTNYIPNTYRLGVKYHDGKWSADAFLRYGAGADTATYFDSNAYYNGSYGHYVGSYADSNYLNLDLSITYKASKDLSIYVKGYNLLNEAYAEYGGTVEGHYDYPAQSRRFIVGAEYKF